MDNPAGQSPVVCLKVDGKIHKGWMRCTVQRNLDALSGAFSLTLSHQWLDGGKLRSLDMREGAPCVLEVDGEPVITGYVVDVTPEYSGDSHQINVQGQDKAGDLVDCSAPVRDWHGRTLTQIATDICAPFGIAVHALDGVGAPFPKFATNPGDTCQATLERLLRQRGLWAWSDGLGGLNIGAPKAGPPIDELERGRNVLSAQGKRSMAGRFSGYTVLGQHNPGSVAGDDDDDDGGTSAKSNRHPQGQARDDGVGRYRPLIVVAEAEGGGVSFGVRAEFEARVRRAKGHKPTVTVQGWRDADGFLWKPGDTVLFDDDWLGVESPWLISNVEFSQGSDGSVSRLTLAKPEAFDLLPQPDGKEKKKKRRQEDDDE